MMHWTNVCVEGYCMAETDGDVAPCERTVPHSFCLGNGITGCCPHFGWSDTTERSAASFVPLGFILKDRIGIWWGKITSKVSWWLWDQLWFNQRKIGKFLDDIKVIPDDDPIMVKMREENRKQQVKFEKWFPKAKKGW